MKILFLSFFLSTLTIISHCYTYDYLLFVQEIPQTPCNSRTCTRSESGTMPVKGVNMHGMWPQYFNGSWPQYCGELKSDEYSDDKISSQLVVELNANWDGFSEFRNHEWQRHGSCFIEGMPKQTPRFLSLNSIDQPMNLFFQTVMQIKQKLNFEQIIFNSSNSNEQQNTNGISWNYQDLHDQLSQKSLGGVQSFLLDCDSEQNLYTMIVCLDKSNYTPIECPSNLGFKGHCQQDQVIHVPFFNLDQF